MAQGTKLLLVCCFLLCLVCVETLFGGNLLQFTPLNFYNDGYSTTVNFYYKGQFNVPQIPANINSSVGISLGYTQNLAANPIISAGIYFNAAIGQWVATCWMSNMAAGTLGFNCTPVAVAPGTPVLVVMQFNPVSYIISATVTGVGYQPTSFTYPVDKNWFEYTQPTSLVSTATFLFGVGLDFTDSHQPPDNSIYFYNLELFNATYLKQTPVWCFAWYTIANGSININGTGVQNYNTSLLGTVAQITWVSGFSTSQQPYGFTNQYFPGGDFIFGSATSYMDCAKQCDSLLECVAWSWGNPTCTNSKFKCFLKNSTSGSENPSVDTCWISNVKLGQTGLQRSSASITPLAVYTQTQTASSFQSGDCSAAVCAMLCNNNAQCLSWSFGSTNVATTGCQCTLYNTVAPIAASCSSSSCVSGLRGIQVNTPYFLINNPTPTPITYLDSNTAQNPQNDPNYPRAFMSSATGLLPNHQWRVLNAGIASQTMYFMFQSVASGKCYNGNETDATFSNGTKVISQPSSGAKTPFVSDCNIADTCQHWEIVPQAATSGSYVKYRINRRNDPVRCLDGNVGGIGQANVAYPSPFLWTCTENPPLQENHKWVFSFTQFNTSNPSTPTSTP